MTFAAEFGFLPKPTAFQAGGVRVRPRSDFSDTLARVKERVNNGDGFYYPPETWKVRLPDWPDTATQERIPNTERPAQLFSMPASHIIEIEVPASDKPLEQDVSFVVQVLAYIYGTRLQPTGWQFDGRVPICRETHHVVVSPQALERVVERAVEEWRAQSVDRRLRLSNILYMHAKAPSYDWPWEQFFMQYLVTDAIYDYAYRNGTVVPAPHEERIRELSGRLGVWCPEEAPVRPLVDMRNALFHEALWEEERPGYRISAEAYYRVREFRSLNNKLIAAVLAGASDYTRTPWTQWREMGELV